MSNRPISDESQADRIGGQAIGRRRFLRLAALALGGAALTGTGAGPALAQTSKQAASYQSSPNGGNRCADCRHFNASNSTCRIVEGQISPNGWCRYFQRAGGRGGY